MDLWNLPEEPLERALCSVSFSHLHSSPAKGKIRDVRRSEIGYGPSELKTPVPNRDCKVERKSSPFSYSSKCVDSTIYQDRGRMSVTPSRLDFLPPCLNVLRLRCHDLRPKLASSSWLWSTHAHEIPLDYGSRSFALVRPSIQLDRHLSCYP